MMESLRKTQKKYTAMAMSAAVCLALVLLLCGQRAACRGLLLGSIFSTLNFFLIGLTLPHRMGKSRSRATIISLATILIRYAILAIPIILAVKYAPYDLVATIVGIFMVQIMILLDRFLVRNSDFRVKP